MKPKRYMNGQVRAPKVVEEDLCATRREGCEEKGARGEEPLTVSFIPRSTTVLVGSDATVMVPALPKVVSVGRLPVENGDAPCHCSAHWYNYLLVCVVHTRNDVSN